MAKEVGVDLPLSDEPPMLTLWVDGKGDLHIDVGGVPILHAQCWLYAAMEMMSTKKTNMTLHKGAAELGSVEWSPEAVDEE